MRTNPSSGSFALARGNGASCSFTTTIIISPYNHLRPGLFAKGDPGDLPGRLRRAHDEECARLITRARETCTELSHFYISRLVSQVRKG